MNNINEDQNELFENINEDQNEFLLNRIVGENAKDFKTECCVIIKQHVSHEYPHWKDIPTDIKRKLWLGMKQKFNLTDDLPVKKAIYEQLNRQYRSYQHKLHAHYLKHKGTQNILEQCPTGVSRGDWELLSNYFESDDFKKVSDQNKKNRQKLTMRHTCGTKSIAQYCYEEKDIVRLHNEPNEEDGDAMNEDDAFIQVLGDEKSSRLRGCGDGLKPPSKARGRINAELQKENEDLRKQVEKGLKSIGSFGDIGVIV
ncbi:hypothetical protein C2S52_009980 [Perilla frutescens var. hirtella]|nr:hypothetical protein C2S52_009980 [Perilla frutescens var. hirtella]